MLQIKPKMLEMKQKMLEAMSHQAAFVGRVRINREFEDPLLKLLNISGIFRFNL